MAVPRTRTKGTGSVRQLKSGRWQARYEENDKFRSLGTFDTKTAATNALAKVRVAKIDRTYRSPEQTRNTVGAYAAEWLARRTDDIDDSIKGSTLSLYRNLLDRWINTPLDNDGVPFTLGEFQLGALTPQVVQQWTNLIRKAIIRNLEERSRPSEAVAIRIWAKSKGLDVAPTGRISPSLREKWEAAGSPYPPVKAPPKTAGETTRRQAYRMLHQIMQDAWANEIISANPCRKNPKVTTRPKRPIASLEEVQAMTDAAPDEYAAAVQLAALGGLRDGEIKALRRNDITILHDDSGQVSGALVRVDERNYRGEFDTPKTEAGTRMVRLAPAPARYLAGHLGLFAPDGDDDALIFEQTKNWHTWWRKARAAAGRPDIRFHDLRHTFASVAIGNGADPTAVQAVLGHATASMTQHYTHAVGDPAARVADTMARVLGEAD